MKYLRCPECGGNMTATIEPLHPMAAVAAEMLEYGVILRCSKCMSYSSSAAGIECPQCGKKVLVSVLSKQEKPQSTGFRKWAGMITCKSCGWKQELH